MVRANQRSAEQALSRLAFGRDHRLAVVAALLKRAGELVDKKLIAADTGIPDTTVYYELVRMERLGVLTEANDGSRVWYSLVDGPFWAWAMDLIDQASLDDRIGSNLEDLDSNEI